MDDNWYLKTSVLLACPGKERVEFWGKERKKRGGGGGALSCKVPIGSGALHDTSCKIWGWEVFFFFFLKTFIHVLFGMLFLFIGGIQRFSVWSQFDSPICFSSMSDFLLARNVFFLGVFSYINYVKLLTWTNYISKNLGTQVFNNSFHNCWLQKFGIKASCCWGGMLWLPDWCIIKWSMLGLSGKWCYSYHNLFL